MIHEFVLGMEYFQQMHTCLLVHCVNHFLINSIQVLSKNGLNYGKKKTALSAVTYSDITRTKLPYFTVTLSCTEQKLHYNQIHFPICRVENIHLSLLNTETGSKYKPWFVSTARITSQLRMIVWSWHTCLKKLIAFPVKRI